MINNNELDIIMSMLENELKSTSCGKIKIYRSVTLYNKIPVENCITIKFYEIGLYEVDLIIKEVILKKINKPVNIQIENDRIYATIQLENNIIENIPYGSGNYGK